MAAQKIGYANKQSGSLWTSSNANEVKDVVNSHADNIDNLSGSLATARHDITDLQTAMQEKAGSDDLEEMATDLAGVETAINGISQALNQKASASDMTQAQEDIQAIQEELSEKADASDVEAALAGKANASDVEAALALKTDVAERVQMESITARIDPNKLYFQG